MKEKIVENHFVWAIERIGGKTYKFTSPGRKGVADRIACLPDGSTWFVELKTKGGRLSALQKMFMSDMALLRIRTTHVYGQQNKLMNSLRPYQDEAADFFYERDRAMILAPVGAGKTAITLTAMQDMLANGVVKRFLVLAPKRVCTDVWPVEQPKWASDVPLAVAVGTPKERGAALRSKAQIVVSNYDNIQWLAEQALDFDAIVFDELTRLKNPSGTRFKALLKVLEPMRVRWGLTGSFTSNGLEDVFGQCKIVDQGLLGRSKGAFMQQYFVLINKEFGEWAPRVGCVGQGHGAHQTGDLCVGCWRVQRQAAAHARGRGAVRSRRP
jgi:hypothetical protein